MSTLHTLLSWYTYGGSCTDGGDLDYDLLYDMAALMQKDEMQNMIKD